MGGGKAGRKGGREGGHRTHQHYDDDDDGGDDGLFFFAQILLHRIAQWEKIRNQTRCFRYHHHHHHFTHLASSRLVGEEVYYSGIYIPFTPYVLDD